MTNQKCVVYSYDKNSPGQAIIDRLPQINGRFTKALIADFDDPATNTRSIKSELQLYKLDRVEVSKIDIE
ncbi:unnamed protein product, partial [Mesorhabditis spiculigera]